MSRTLQCIAEVMEKHSALMDDSTVVSALIRYFELVHEDPELHDYEESDREAVDLLIQDLHDAEWNLFNQFIEDVMHIDGTSNG